MAILQVENITKYFGELPLFNELSFTINHGEKVALVANNGTGKTTLINMLIGADVPSAGTIEMHPNTNIGLLEQVPSIDTDNSIYNEIFNSHKEVIDAQEDYNIAIAKGDENEIQKMTDLMESLEAWDYKTRVDQLVTMMKFPDENQKISSLSGGQKKRVALAQLLLRKPDLLILDEPTNHLDLEIIEWLEGFLKSTSITLLMVTHDRYFLDRVCSTIIEISDAKAFKYNGNYSYFLEKKQERELQQLSEVTKAKNLMRTELDWIRRQPKARGTKAKYRVDAFDDLKKKATSKRNDSELNIAVESKRLGNKIIEFSNIGKSYGDRKLFSDFSYVFNKNEKIGIIGDNGCGKTTLLQIITKSIEPDFGEVEYGETLLLGYYKQDGLQVEPDKKVIEVITDIADSIQLTKGHTMTAAQYLEHWLFPRPMQHMQVGKLSGGEKKRLYLMTVLMKQPNFLILDEPTNDLDLTTLQILEEYLSAFSGCVLIVSHDRFFTDKVVDHIFVFEKDHTISDFAGNYTLYREYLDFKKEQEQKQIKESKPVKEVVVKAEKKGLTYNEKRELELIEKDLDSLSNQKESLESSLQSNALDSEELVKISAQIGDIINSIEEKEMRWLELSEKAEV